MVEFHQAQQEAKKQLVDSLYSYTQEAIRSVRNQQSATPGAKEPGERTRSRDLGEMGSNLAPDLLSKYAMGRVNSAIHPSKNLSESPVAPLELQLVISQRIVPNNKLLQQITRGS